MIKKIIATIISVASLMVLLAACSQVNGAGTTPLSTATPITAFSFTNPVATGIIDENNKTILVIVPNGTDVTSLVATFTSYAIERVGAVIQISGTTANDFTNPVVYSAVLADGSTAAYTVTVTMAREIFVANSSNDTVSVFDSSFNGDMSALRQFGSRTGLIYPQGIAVDTVNNQLFVTNYGNNSITVYGRMDSGNIAPI